MCAERTEGEDEIQTLGLSEKWRFVVLLGRIKENAQSLRQLHAVMAEHWQEVMGPESAYVWGLFGDLKYMSIMNGDPSRVGSWGSITSGAQWSRLCRLSDIGPTFLKKQSKGHL